MDTRTKHMSWRSIGYNAWLNVIQMLHDRGYMVNDEERATEQSHVSGYTVSGLPFVAVHLEEDKLSVKRMRILLSDNPDTAIIALIAQGMTAFTKKELNESGAQVQIFTYLDMSVSAARHCLMPKFEIIRDDARKNAIVHKYSIDQPNSQIPRLLLTDPFVRYYGLVTRDLVCFQRSFGYNAITPFYRIVAAN